MPRGKKGVTINSTLLNTLVTKRGTKIGFARDHNFKKQDIMNWTLGISLPSEHQLKKLCKALEISPEILMLPGELYVAKGWQAALTRWAEQHIENEREPIRDTDAINLIKTSTPDALEEAEDESGESPFYVQGPSKSPDTTE